MMITRSQTAKYEVCIDFDQASNAWKANKKYLGNGSYAYICGRTCKNGKQCSKPRTQTGNYCKQHTWLLQHNRLS